MKGNVRVNSTKLATHLAEKHWKGEGEKTNIAYTLVYIFQLVFEAVNHMNRVNVLYWMQM